MLKVRGLSAKYGVIKAIQNIDLDINKGEIITLIGSNGAGKTTTIKAILNSVSSKGLVEFENNNISKKHTHKIIQSGIAISPEGRAVFASLSVEENIKLGAYNNIDNFSENKEYMYEIFPRLKQRQNQLAGTLSGGEQQMLSIARALVSSPKLLLLDEPSLGLAPKIAHEIFALIQKLQQQNITILLVEQNAFMALKISNRAYVLENGQIVLNGNSAEIMENKDIRHMYLGD